MEQNDAELNQMLNVCSRNGEGQKSLTELRSKNSLSNFQMLQLTQNDQKFTDRLFELNQNGIASINKSNYQEALFYLTEAQKLLQYAASCGRAIDRQIILKILNNEAVVYQKTWDLQRSISYTEAIIFNLNTFLNSRESLQIIKSLRQKWNEVCQANSSFEKEDLEWFFESQFDKISSLLTKKFSISLYYLQFSCLNSQNQDHETGLKKAEQALASYRDAFELNFIFLQLKKVLNITINEQSFKLIQQVVSLIPPNELQYDQVLKKLPPIQKQFQHKSHAPNSFNYILQKYSSLDKKEPKYKNFSLTSVMELQTKSIGDKMILDQFQTDPTLFYIDQIQNSSILAQKVLEYAVVFFTISVEIKELYSELTPSPNMTYVRIYELQQKQKAKESQMYYILSLKLSVQLVEELSQFSRYIYKHYFQVYSQEKMNMIGQSMSKMDSLKEKYKKYLPGDRKYQCNNDSDDDFCDNTNSEYSINIKVSLVNNPKDSKQNKLEKFFKQNAISTPQNAVNTAPPRLNVDISEIQSLEYGGSKTFKQTNNEVPSKLSPHEVIEEVQEDNKQTKKLNCLTVKKIKTVQNLSDVSSNRDSQSQQKSKSSRSNKAKIEAVNKFKQKSSGKKNPSKKNVKSNSSNSKPKPELKRLMSPKHFHMKSFQTDVSNNKSHKVIHDLERKKKSVISQKKILSDRKLNGQKSNERNEKSKSKKNIQLKEKNKKQQNVITPQPSTRNIFQKELTQKNIEKVMDQKLSQTKKLTKLRKAKSFQQKIHHNEEIKPEIYGSKDICDTYHIYQKPKLKEKLKLISDIKKTKSNQSLKFTVKNGRKDNKRHSKIQVINTNISQNMEGKNLIETKDSGIKKKKLNLNLVKTTNKDQLHHYHSSIGIGMQNAVRMSSASNLMNSGNEKSAIRKMNGSKSFNLHDSNYSSSVYLKGVNGNGNGGGSGMNISQRTKAQSIGMMKGNGKRKG